MFCAAGGEKLWEGGLWGYRGLKGGEEEGSCTKGKQSCCFCDTSCTCSTVNDFEVIFSSMSKEKVMGEEEVLIALYMLKQ